MARRGVGNFHEALQDNTPWRLNGNTQPHPTQPEYHPQWRKGDPGAFALDGQDRRNPAGQRPYDHIDAAWRHLDATPFAFDGASEAAPIPRAGRNSHWRSGDQGRLTLDGAPAPAPRPSEPYGGAWRRCEPNGFTLDGSQPTQCARPANMERVGALLVGDQQRLTLDGSVPAAQQQPTSFDRQAPTVAPRLSYPQS